MCEEAQFRRSIKKAANQAEIRTFFLIGKKKTKIQQKNKLPQTLCSARDSGKTRNRFDASKFRILNEIVKMKIFHSKNANTLEFPLLQFSTFHW